MTEGLLPDKRSVGSHDEVARERPPEELAAPPEEFFRIFGELEATDIEVAFEATYGWAWFADLLHDAGIPAHMAHPLGTKAISSARVKNDAVTAEASS